MDIDVAKELCKLLTDLNLKYWRASNVDEKQTLLYEFRRLIASIKDAGYKIRRWRNHGKPMFAPCVERHRDTIKFVEDSNIKNDCTTRCISLCTGIAYDLVRKEQDENAKKMGPRWHWNHDIVWEKSLSSRGFVKINFKRKVSRATFLRIAETCPIHEGKIATASSDHVAAIDMAERRILDTWNSSGGRIVYIFVPASQKCAYIDWLDEVGLICSRGW